MKLKSFIDKEQPQSVYECIDVLKKDKEIFESAFHTELEKMSMTMSMEDYFTYQHKANEYDCLIKIINNDLEYLNYIESMAKPESRTVGNYADKIKS